MRSILILIAALALTTACKDPSRSVPAAQVGEASTQPAEAAGEEAAEADEPTTVQEIAINAENTTVTFVGSKVTGSHDGGFNELSGTFQLREPVEASRAQVVININSLWSDNDRLTGHLLSDDFFDAATYPEATFRIDSLEAGAEGAATHTVRGDLTLHGVTRSISYPATISVTDEAVTVASEFSINRRDFGIVYAGQPDDLIRDGVVIRLALNLARN